MWTSFYRFVVWVLMVVFRIVWCRVVVVGKENIPRGGKGYILCANHTSNVDPIMLAVADRRQIIHFMGKDELFRVPLLGGVFKRLGAFPVRRGEGDMDAIGRAMALLENGDVLGLFPEGGRSKDGKPMRPKSGVALIAGETGADVLPAGIWYEKGGPRFRGRVVVRFGAVIPAGEIAYAGRSGSEFKRISRMIMERIVRLTGPAEEVRDEG